jgi:hypothetical protein
MTTDLTAKSVSIVRATVAAISLLLPINAAYAEPPEIIKAETDTRK